MKPPIRQGKYTRVSPARQTKRTVRRRWNWFWRLSRKQKIMVIAAPILAFLILVPLVTYLVYARDIADQERLMNRNNTGIVLTDKDGKSFYSVGRAEHREMVPLDQISDSTKEALIATEDKDFYRHSGFSIAGFVRAATTRVGGGSTITQQLAKNTLLTDERSYLRKYQELFMSIAIENTYTKDQILEMYLNSVYFGENAFGIEEAARVYYNKAPKDLTLAESAMLIGLLPAPSSYSPISGNMEYARQRQNTVLSRMVTERYITEAEKESAYAVQLQYPGGGADASAPDVAPHFAEMVIKDLSDRYGYERVMRSGYQVKTTLDRGLQDTLKKNIDGHMSFIQANGGSNAAGVAIDPKTGGIMALVGSADWKNDDWGKVNIVTSARQPGSSFKPIYYAAALADGVVTPATVLEDKQTDFGGGYTPQNADRRFRGKISLRNAISQSLNIPSVLVMQKYGVTKSIEAANRLGIDTIKTDQNYGLSLALGSAEARPLDMTNAYAAFANKGQQYTPETIQEIDDKFDHNIYRANPKSKQVINPEGSFLISSILSDNNARAPIFGGSLTVAGHTAAVKTGTTNDSRDAWTIGYTPSIALGVWVGNNDNAEMANGGSGMAGPIWRETMNDYLRGKPDEKFEVPGGVVQRNACRSTGGLANSGGYGTYQEYFKAGALPDPCTPAEEPKVTACDKQSKQMVQVTESQLSENQARYSRDAADCQDEQISVCVLDSGGNPTGRIQTIDESDFNSSRYSRDTANCQAETTTQVQVCTIDSNGRITGGPVTVDEDYDTSRYTETDAPQCLVTQSPTPTNPQQPTTP